MVTTLVGAQFGSEGKGAVAGHIAGGYNIHVRVGAANAGHTVYVGGDKHVVQQLPCAAYANPWAQLVLGAGALISPDILMHEIKDNVLWREYRELPKLRLVVDHRAHCVTLTHVAKEQQSGLAESIGSTSTIAKEGIGAAQAARVMREGYALFSEHPYSDADGIDVLDTVDLLHDAKVFGMDILLEGTQGTGLSNNIGFYPYVTSRNVTASGIAADVGFGPKDIDSVILVARSYPIRVAGNSGPFWPDSNEVSWMDLGVDQEKERTTVTRKIRRVATFSYEQIKHAVRVNSGTEIVLMFADYLTPELANRGGVVSAEEFDTYDYAGAMVREIESKTLTPVTMVGTGPATIMDRQPGQTWTISPSPLSER